ncbi:hypothetical protein [Ulvibacterium sp.]|uniref:hypothetical protein n=1 Tax=Ulvibacterium sp. TaxID=2665914 RepID=UPI002605ABAC|nr:hypothetical protein [Ulvibacterium sp.]
MKKCMLMFVLLVLAIIIATISEKKDEKELSYSLADKEVSLNNSVLSQNNKDVGTTYEQPSNEPLK